MANMQTAAPVMDEAAIAEMRRLIFDAPIQELADAQGISIDEAVQLRVEKNLEAAEVPIEVSVRPIEPQGKLIGFASVGIPRSWLRGAVGTMDYYAQLVLGGAILAVVLYGAVYYAVTYLSLKKRLNLQ